MRNRRLLADLAACALFLLLAVLLFWATTLGGQTLIPADNAFAWDPWRSYASAEGIVAPHNGLLSDLYLENYAWKRLIVDAIEQRELPLWNPYVFTGVPFLAAGQHSALYPFSVLFYVLPLAAAYGWFAALHLALAGSFCYLLARTLRVSRGGALIAGVAFELCGFVVISNVFPMIVAAAVWLPLVLVAISASCDGSAQAPVSGSTCPTSRWALSRLAWPSSRATPRCTFTLAWLQPYTGFGG